MTGSTGGRQFHSPSGRPERRDRTDDAINPGGQGGRALAAIDSKDGHDACECGIDHAHRPDHSHPSSDSDVSSHPAPSAIPPDALIVASNLGVVRTGRTILANVSMHVAPGEILTLIGPNGAGKTTLVRALLGLEPIQSGRIERRPGLSIGYVPQRFAVDPSLPMTVARFLALGLERQLAGRRDAAIAEALAEVGAGRLAGSQMSALSGGETQRVLLARALLRRPPLLVLDEPVQGVDFAGEAELYALIAELRRQRGFAVLLISHDLHVVMGASDRVLCLNRHICCSGVPTAVAAHPEYERLFGRRHAAQFAVYEHRHDHRHDLAGRPLPALKSGEPASQQPAGAGESGD